MRQKMNQVPFDTDIRIDYALIAAGVASTLFAFIYLLLV